MLVGALAGLAGAVYAFSKGSISPSAISIAQSTDGLIMVLLGGVETLTGPLAGAAIFTWLRDEVARRTEFWRAVMGGVILAIVLLFPQGLVGGLKALTHALARGPIKGKDGMSAVLQVEGLHKSFGGVQAVADVSFAVDAGELLALIGPNGAGKSTCFNMLNGQLAPDAGIVRLEGRNIVGLRPRAIWRLGVGRTFQITATFASLSVRENVQMALYSHAGRLRSLLSRFGTAFAAEADALLGQVGMLDQAERPCGVLAYGDLKRVELAMALANQPRLLLMDEPTAGMAPKERVALMELAAGLARAQKIAVLFTEHDMDVVFSQADRIIVLDRGQLIAGGTPAGGARQSRRARRLSRER